MNCLQPHPTTCLLATSGIDPYVRIWSPRPEDADNEHSVTDFEKTTSANQRRMNADPFESFLMDMGYRVRDMGIYLFIISNGADLGGATGAMAPLVFWSRSIKKS